MLQLSIITLPSFFSSSFSSSSFPLLFSFLSSHSTLQFIHQHHLNALVGTRLVLVESIWTVHVKELVRRSLCSTYTIPKELVRPSNCYEKHHSEKPKNRKERSSPQNSNSNSHQCIDNVHHAPGVHLCPTGQQQTPLILDMSLRSIHRALIMQLMRR